MLMKRCKKKKKKKKKKSTTTKNQGKQRKDTKTFCLFDKTLFETPITTKFNIFYSINLSPIQQNNIEQKKKLSKPGI